MAENLIIGVTLDTSKLGADIELMKAQLSAARTEQSRIARDNDVKEGYGR